MAEPEKIIRIAGIELSPAGIKPVTGNLATMVRADEITEVIVHRGARSHHPLLQFVVGAALMSLFWVLARIHLERWLAHRGPISAGVGYLVASGLIGAWVMLDSFSRGYYLRVRTKRGKHKISLDKKASPEMVKAVCRQLRERKYVVLVDAPL